MALTLERTVSVMFDWGVEALVYRSPSSFIKDFLPSENIFPIALPIPDHDHALHHVSGFCFVTFSSCRQSCWKQKICGSYIKKLSHFCFVEFLFGRCVIFRVFEG